jgi:hypothetical protein
VELASIRVQAGGLSVHTIVTRKVTAIAGAGIAGGGSDTILVGRNNVNAMIAGVIDLDAIIACPFNSDPIVTGIEHPEPIPAYVEYPNTVSTGRLDLDAMIKATGSAGDNDTMVICAVELSAISVNSSSHAVDAAIAGKVTTIVGGVTAPCGVNAVVPGCLDIDAVVYGRGDAEPIAPGRVYLYPIVAGKDYLDPILDRRSDLNTLVAAKAAADAAAGRVIDRQRRTASHIPGYLGPRPQAEGIGHWQGWPAGDSAPAYDHL